MSEQIAKLLVKIEAADVDENELEDLTRLLQEDIASLDVESVEPVKGGDIPKGAMAAEWYEIGVLSIKMATAVLPPLILAVKAWIDRQSQNQNADRKETSASDQWKVKIGLGALSIDVERTTSKQEIVDKTAQLQKQIENT
ncbi:hypothetical protein QUF70_10720 [Desulfobacterales bacterium HSG17]|nr:hypothetical protein [Desulfobacterales bacterium HSG17]